MGRNTRKAGVLVLISFFSTIALAQNEIKAVVGITVDQMRAEYLERFAPHFTGGFQQFLSSGLIYRNCHYSHIPTYTAPGHATIFTGAQPRDHGIIGNDWYDPITKTEHYCVEDTLESTIGISTSEGDGMKSPRNLRTTTVTDELHLSTGGQSYIGAVSIKDRGAILPGGHAADEAYWFGSSGQFVTSTYYTDETPEWVQSFHAKNASLADYTGIWDYMIEEEAYSACLPDDNPYESTFGNSSSAFPHDVSEWVKTRGPKAMLASPYGNQYLTDFATAMIDNIPAEIADDQYVDFISVSYSSPDYIGHAYGPRSREVMDTYLRLDLELKRLFDAMDAKYGEGNWVVFLSADHGVAENPNHFGEELRMNATNHSSADLMVEMVEISEDIFGVNVIEKFYNNSLYLDESQVVSLGIEQSAIREKLALGLSQVDAFKKIWTLEEINSTDSYQAKLRRNLVDERSAGLFIEWRDGNYIYSSVGASHGSGYTYDTHVPMLLMGPSIPAGNVYRKVHVVDLAPTLSLMLGTALPHAAFGEVLEEALPFIEY
ncbi:alkaline phosphatase family protein [Phaeocystidibacter luteus]|uniref:Alkaline phosphatase family protein n=1 Tax=Phaeocystidibacter luteus TaxID=911197 RepID=A0A6N6RJ67_9FLAO|nr:alkaline phosphatase family protein [Phaeocystidibacter luteus]KAB2813674.1 alkaline phosphatase family protein [Phaeocystidibacter luteus]